MKKFRLRNGEIIESEFEFGYSNNNSDWDQFEGIYEGYRRLYCYTPEGSWTFDGRENPEDIIEEVTDSPQYRIKAGVTVEKLSCSIRDLSHWTPRLDKLREVLLKAGLLEEVETDLTEYPIGMSAEPIKMNPTEYSQSKYGMVEVLKAVDKTATEWLSKGTWKSDCLNCNFTLSSRSSQLSGEFPCFHPDKKKGGCPK